MNIKCVLTLSVLLITGCAVTPQALQVAPALSLDALKGVAVPIELVVSDKRENQTHLGYRNAKQEGEIKLTDSVAKSLGESIQSALIYQGVSLPSTGSASTRLEVQLYELNYFTPDETWVSQIEMDAEVLLIVSRSSATIKKRFKANRKQDVVTAPTKEFNEKYMNALLSELMNKALNDKEIVEFLK